MKAPITEAPEHIQFAFREAQKEDPLYALEIALDAGFDPGPPLTPTVDRLLELRSRPGASVVAAQYEVSHSLSLLRERAALVRYKGVQTWLAGAPSNAEKSAELRKQREAAELEAAVQRRADELLDQELRAARARAVERARVELAQQPAGGDAKPTNEQPKSQPQRRAPR